MDPALVDGCHVDYCRVGVYNATFDKIMDVLKKRASYSLTRRKLFLYGTVDSVTGWYDYGYVDSTIEGVMIPKGAAPQGLPGGTFVALDMLFKSLDPVKVGDQIKTVNNEYYEVKTVTEITEGDDSVCLDCQLRHLPFYEE